MNRNQEYPLLRAFGMLNNRNIFLLQNQPFHVLKRYPSLLLECVVFVVVPNNVHISIYHIGYTTSIDPVPRAATADNSQKKGAPHYIFNVVTSSRFAAPVELRTLIAANRDDFFLADYLCENAPRGHHWQIDFSIRFD